MKKAAATYKMGDDELFQLFDIGETDHVHDLLASMADPAPKKEREAMAKTLRALLGVPIERLRDRIFESGRGERASEYGALDRFALAVDVAALQLSARPTLTKDEAQGIADNLRSRWLEFIAYAAAFRMYHDMPREMNANKRRTDPLLKSRAERADEAKQRGIQMVARYAELKAAKSGSLRKAVAKEFGVSPETIKNVWNNRDRKIYPG